MASPRCRRSPKRQLDALERLPGKSLAHARDQPTTKPQLAGFSGAASCHWRRQLGPSRHRSRSRGQLALRQRQHAGARRRHLRRRGIEQQRAVVAPAVPAVF
ncbi:MAG: hypothetical protein MZV49_27100 [Rhodopseudomonas palustris]|nr:hypothetical protein [Rhodopseudomonas palustris]